MTQPPHNYQPPSPSPTDQGSSKENVSNNLSIEHTEEDTETYDSDSNFTDCTTTNKNNLSEAVRMSDPLNTHEGLSPAYTINASLSKITISDKLTDSNYISWSISIQRALRSVGLQSYIKDESSMNNDKHFNTHCDCITNWLLNSMDSAKANWMQSRIMVPDDENLELIYSPQKLCEETRRYHAPCTEAARFRLETELDAFKQGYKVNLITHLDNFTVLKDRLLLAGGKTSTERLARRLLQSLNSSHKEMIDSIIRNITPLSYEAVETEIKRLISENSAITGNNVSSANVNV